MTRPGTPWWIDALFAPSDGGIDCPRCREWLAAYVDAELNSQVGIELRSEVRQHLDCCWECRELYEALKHVVSLADAGTLPDPDVLFFDDPFESDWELFP
ncbi:MAG: anti-sigma factor family protein [Anaerolineae bacterium]